MQVQISEHAVRRYREVIDSNATVEQAEAAIRAAAEYAKPTGRVSTTYPGRERYRAPDKRRAPWAKMYLWVERGVVQDIEPPHAQHRRLGALIDDSEAELAQLREKGRQAAEDRPAKEHGGAKMVGVQREVPKRRRRP